MVTTPPDTPVTIPVVLTDPIEGFEEVHVPPVVGSLRDMVEPTHTAIGPVMADGDVLTVTVLLVEQVPKE
jgi:hypothetical protein